MGALILFVVVLLAYVPAIRGGFIWDDGDYVTENENLRTWGGLAAIWLDVGATSQYYPMVYTSFWVEHQLWGLNPFGYHLVNVLLHALSGVLLWIVLRRLSLPGAWLAAVVFALHPVHVESVAWITERKNVLSGVFYLGGLLVYLEYAGLRGAADMGRGQRRFYAIALVLFAAALLSKTVTCSLPAAVLLLIWWKRGRLSRQDVVPLISFFLIGLVMAMATALMEKHHVGAQGRDWDLSSVDRCLIAGRALWFYLAKLVWPANLAFFYPRWNIDSGVWWQYVYPATAVGLIAALWVNRRRIGRGPLTGVLFFGGTLLPALGFIDVYPMRFSFVADHFQYLASIGPIALLVALVTMAVGGLTRYVGTGPGSSRRWGLGPLQVVPAGLLLVALGALTWRQGHNYKDVETLWRNTLATNPSAWLAHFNLGEELRRKGDVDGALACVRQALKLKPDDYQIHYHLGQLLLTRGRVPLAQKHLAEAVELLPKFPRGHFLLGVALERLGRDEEADREYDIAFGPFALAVKDDPDALDAHLGLARIYSRRGQLDEAIQHYVEGLRLAPENRAARRNLAEALARQGRTGEAIEHLRRLVGVPPEDSDARCSLGDVLRQEGRLEEAIEEYRRALEVDPDHRGAREGLSAALSVRER